MESKYIVESDITIRAVDKPFNQRQILGVFSSPDNAYQFIEKYLLDTKNLHTYFSRGTICPKDEYEEHIKNGKIVAINVVLGQFEDTLYVTKVK